MYIDKANPCVCLSSTLFIMLNSFALCSSLKQLNLSVSLKVNEIKIVNKKHFLILVDLIRKYNILCCLPKDSIAILHNHTMNCSLDFA